MEQSEMMNGQEKNALAGEVMESLGEPEDATVNVGEPEAEKESKDDLPKAAKERLGRQEKRHKKELRELQAQIAQLHDRMGSHRMPEQQQPANTYTPQPVAGEGIEHHIHQAVNAALQAREQQEQQRAQAERMAHVQKSYRELEDHLDNASNEHEDFDDVVKSNDAPFSEAIRDAALLLPRSGPGSAANVLYKIGKNREELKRINSLHPLDQAKEMVRLSIALQSGGNSSEAAPRQLGNIKSSPVVSPGSVNENTSVGDLRRKLKAGWK